MSYAEPTHRRSSSEFLDIAAELAYWRAIYPQRRFFRKRRDFQEYVPTIKFGYDSYLLFHKEDLSDLLPRLRKKYQLLPARQQIDWIEAVSLLEATWQRMGWQQHVSSPPHVMGVRI